MFGSNEYKVLHAEFMNIFAEEQRDFESVNLYSTMEKGLKKGTFWYSLALSSFLAFSIIFYEYMQSKFATGHEIPEFWSITMLYCFLNTAGLIEKKVKDKERYDASLQEEFHTKLLFSILILLGSNLVPHC